MDWNRIKALFWLAVTFWVHLFHRLFGRGAPGLATFDAHYRADGIWPLPAEERAAMPALGGCVSCRLCDPVCPAMHADAGGGFVGPSRLVMADSRLLPALASWLDPFLCIRCRACDDACPEGIEIDRLVGGMRGATHRDAREVVPAELRLACERVARAGHLLEPPPRPPEAARSRADYVLFAGCAASEADRATEAALLARAGVSFSPGPGLCCGAFERSAGAPGAGARIEAFLEALAAQGAFQVATADPRCYAFLRREARYRREVAVTHVLELAQGLRAHPGAAGEPEDAPRVTYHDPCELVRAPGGADLPREAIRRAGAELVEMPRVRREAPCCGMGGGTWTFNPALAEELGRARVREAVATGAAVLLTQSALCRDHLARCASQEGGGIAVRNVVDLLAERVGIAKPDGAPARAALARAEEGAAEAPPGRSAAEERRGP
jgi:Fe-S oxidoreductase